MMGWGSTITDEASQCLGQVKEQKHVIELAVTLVTDGESVIESIRNWLRYRLWWDCDID